MLSLALEHAFTHTGFLAAALAQRSLRLSKGSRLPSQRRHDANSMLVLRGVLSEEPTEPRVVALGTPNKLAEAAELLARSERDNLVVLCLPGAGLAQMAENETQHAPDRVDSLEMQQQAYRAELLLRNRIDVGTALVLRTTPRGEEGAFFEQWVEHFVEVLTWLRENHHLIDTTSGHQRSPERSMLLSLG